MSTQAAAAAHQLVVFSLGGDDYALPIGQIKEVIRYTKPRSVTTHETWVSGVISLRGTIVAIGDIASRLGATSIAADDAKIVIVEADGRSVGIVVDAVDEVLTLAATDLDTTVVGDDDLVCGIAKLGERLVLLLDAHALLAAIPRPPSDESDS